MQTILLPLLKKWLTKELLLKLLRSEIGHTLMDELFTKAESLAKSTDTSLDDHAVKLFKQLVHDELNLDHNEKH